eukprot:scaffold85517_cov32-Tisochrysis_lutea.AAC.1
MLGGTASSSSPSAVHFRQDADRTMWLSLGLQEGLLGADNLMQQLPGAPYGLGGTGPSPRWHTFWPFDAVSQMPACVYHSAVGSAHGAAPAVDTVTPAVDSAGRPAPIPHVWRVAA